MGSVARSPMRITRPTPGMRRRGAVLPCCCVGDNGALCVGWKPKSTSSGMVSRRGEEKPRVCLTEGGDLGERTVGGG
jgi:hypothetical protein